MEHIMMNDISNPKFIYHVDNHLLESNNLKSNQDLRGYIFDYIEDFFDFLQLGSDFGDGVIHPSVYSERSVNFKNRKKESRLELKKCFESININQNFNKWISNIIFYISTNLKIKELQNIYSSLRHVKDGDHHDFRKTMTKFNNLKFKINHLESNIIKLIDEHK
jgi:hypothetical protein